MYLEKKRYSSRAAVLGTVALVAWALGAQAQNAWKVDYGQSSVKFYIKHAAGMTQEGRFDQFQVQVRFDPQAPEKASFSGTIEAASINTELSMRDNQLRSKDYLEVETYPRIRFQSTGLSRGAGDSYWVEGQLTIKKTNKTVKLPLKVEQKGALWLFTAELPLNRVEYGVGTKSWMLASELKAVISVAAAWSEAK
ncbi:MAG: YceI family protein [Cytophagales bacterium]|nr:YceI family protein [Cytophagales bacterium]